MRLVKKGENKMRATYSDQELPSEVVKTIFLAGPTPRDQGTESWRKEALEIFEKLNYTGDVFIPEPSDGVFSHSYDEQIDWEIDAMNRADIIVFWVPRELKQMPAFTTNVEFGAWINSGKVVFGFPEEAEKMRYLEALAARNNVASFSTLEDTLKEAINKVGEGAKRINGEVEVPLFVWNTVSFQNWYKAQTGAGNELVHADLKFTHRVGKKKDIVFLWILHVEVYVKVEDRIKSNEVVISRTNTSSIIMYGRKPSFHFGYNLTLYDYEVVLVKEFRSPASTKDGFIWELPGGSSNDDKKDMFEVIIDEIHEEVGIKLAKERIKYVQERQQAGTLLANKVSLYSVELSNEEIDWLKSQKGIAKGVVEDTEMAYTEVVGLKEIMEKELVDWTNIGMILSVLTKERN